MNSIAIIGVGNPFRGDDGAGFAVIDALQEKVTSPIKLCKIRGDIVELMEAFAKYSTIYLVDACCMNAMPGFWQRIDALAQSIPEDNTQTSTHGFSISQAIALAKTLAQLPSKLIIYAINGDHYNVSNNLSSPVALAIGEVVKNIMNEEDIQACMKKA